MVLEFTLNEHPDEPFTDPQRQGYEQLVRKLLQLPGRCVLAVGAAVHSLKCGR